MNSLRLEHTAEGVHSGSAYDMFLAKNGLPAQPAQGESDAAYSQRLLQNLEKLQNPRFVLPYERWLRFHPHVLEFGKPELDGLKIFSTAGRPIVAEARCRNVCRRSCCWRGCRCLECCWVRREESEDASLIGSSQQLPAFFSAPSWRPRCSGPATDQLGGSNSASHIGNCVSCHPAPEFTDFRFHNTGAAQEEYDAVHGAGSFMRLTVPSYAERRRRPDQYLPATANHPSATGVFRAVPAVEQSVCDRSRDVECLRQSGFSGRTRADGRLLCDTRPLRSEGAVAANDCAVQNCRVCATWDTPGRICTPDAWPPWKMYSTFTFACRALREPASFAMEIPNSLKFLWTKRTWPRWLRSCALSTRITTTSVARDTFRSLHCTHGDWRCCAVCFAVT